MTMYHCNLLEHEDHEMMASFCCITTGYWIWWNIWAIVIIYICIWSTCRI